MLKQWRCFFDFNVPTRSNYRNDGRKQFSFDDTSVSKLLRDVSFGKHGSFKANHVFLGIFFFLVGPALFFWPWSAPRSCMGVWPYSFFLFFHFSVVKSPILFRVVDKEKKTSQIELVHCFLLIQIERLFSNSLSTFSIIYNGNRFLWGGPRIESVNVLAKRKTDFLSLSAFYFLRPVPNWNGHLLLFFSGLLRFSWFPHWLCATERISNRTRSRLKKKKRKTKCNSNLLIHQFNTQNGETKAKNPNDFETTKKNNNDWFLFSPNSRKWCLLLW